MTPFVSFQNLPTQFSIRPSLSVFSCFYQRHLTHVRCVLKVCACLVFGVVKNSYVRNDVHIFTNPGEFWIPDSIIYGIMLVYL